MLCVRLSWLASALERSISHHVISPCTVSCDCDRCAKTRSSAVHGKDETCKCCWLPPGFRTGILNLPFRLLSALFGYLAQLSALAFSVTAVVWYALYRCGTTAGLYVEVVSVVFVIGWMFTLQFTKGFQTMHAFSIMLKYIVLRDITRFLVMYVFVLLGFGFAFHALFQLSPTIADPLGSPFNTLFTAFNMMLGMGDSPVDSGFDATYEASGGDPVFVKWVYILYVAISTIILLSLLIAMMTDTFTDIKSKEATTWQVGSLRLALRIERSMPFLRRALCCSGRDRVTYDGELGRWMMSTGVVGVGGGRAAAAAARSKEESIDELLKVVLRLDNKLDYLQNAYVDLSRQVDTVSDAVQGRDAANGVASRSRRPPGPASFYNIAKSMMTRGARPTSATGRNARSTKL